MAKTRLAREEERNFDDTFLASDLERGQSPVQKGTTGPAIRIAIIVSHPIQYYAPYYRALAAVPGVVLKVFFCCRDGVETYYDRDFNIHVKWDIPLLEGYDSEFLDGPNWPQSVRSRISASRLFQRPPFNFWTIDNPRVGQSLAKFNPDVVDVVGYSHRTISRTIRWCNRNKVPVIVSSDSNVTARSAWWKRAVKTLVVRRIYSRLDGALANGDNNRAYHLAYRCPEERIFTRAFPVDCHALRESAGDPDLARTEIRSRHGIPRDAFVVIFAGKLSSIKCPSHLLAAVQRCSQQGLNVWGLLAGDGQLRSELEALISQDQMKNVVLAGFVNQSMISKYYAASDAVTLMSSYEPKGQTVPEAGSLGCPAILSDRIGCIGPNDCARPGENALVYPWGDINAFADSISRMYRSPELYRSMSEAAVRIANLQDARVAAMQMKEAASALGKTGFRRKPIF